MTTEIKERRQPDGMYRLRKEAEAAKRLIAALKETGDDEDDIVESAVEGETDLLEAIAGVIDCIDDEEIVIAGGEAKIAEIKARVDAKKRRVEFMRAAIEQAMLTSERESVNLPTATVFISKRKPGVVIESEADIPAEFFKQPEPPAPRLDKRALASALNEGREIPGASLDNGTVSISIRRK